MLDAFSSDILTVLLLIIAFLLFKHLGTFLNLSRTRLRATEWLPAARADAPSHVLRLLACAEPELKAIGFERASTLAAEPPNLLDPRARIFADLYWHEEWAVLARVELADPSSGQAVKVQFTTLFAGGKALLTVNREKWGLSPAPEELIIVDAYADSLRGQWQAHRGAVALEAEHRAVVADMKAAIKRQTAFGLPRWLARMAALGWVRKEGPERYRFTAVGAWRYARQLARPSAAVRNALARPYRHDPAPDIRAVRMAEMDAAAADLVLSAQPFPSWLKASFFILTLMFSAILFGGGFGLMDALALPLVLLIHEGGHLAGMWTLGYRDLSIFFLPFIAAAAPKRKPLGRPWQEVAGLLAGPVVSLMLAMAASQIPADALSLPAVEFLRSFVWFGLVLSLFNLLPFGVLDGGRLFERAVLGRFPYARAVCTVLGLAVGVLCAVWAESIPLGLVMCLLLLSAPREFHTARIAAAIHAKAKAANLSSLNREMAIRALGQAFADGDYGGSGPKGWLKRRHIARLVYPRLLQGMPGLGVTAGALAVQIAALLTPLLLIAWSWQQPDPAPLLGATATGHQELGSQRRVRPAERQSRTAARDAFIASYITERDAHAKWTMLEQHEKDLEIVGFNQAHQDWLEHERTALSDLLPADHAGKLRRRLIQAAPGTIGATESLLSVISLLGGDDAIKAAALDEERFALLVNAYARLAQEAPPETLEGPAAAVERLCAALEAPDHPHARRWPELASIRARMAFSAGRVDEAEAWMGRYRANAHAQPEYAALIHAWFLLDMGHHERVQALAHRAVTSADPAVQSRPHWQILAGWAEMGLGHPREADAYFQAVLDERNARLEDARNGRPRWLRLLSRRPEARPEPVEPIDAPTLDHLAALESYDPQGAARLIDKLAQQRTASQIVSTYAGWGNARHATHVKLMKALNVVRNEAPIKRATANPTPLGPD